MKKYIAILPLLCSCIVVIPDEPGDSNACMAPGKDYSETFTESPGGTCGPRNPSAIGVGSDGNILLGSGVTCSVSRNDGCTSYHQCTVPQQNGCQISVDSKLTFTESGSLSGTEGILIQCPDGSYCASQYQVTGHKQ